METLTLTLHKTKDTKNEVAYGTKDGSVIQSVYIDKDALGDNPPAAIQVVLTRRFHNQCKAPVPAKTISIWRELNP